MPSKKIMINGRWRDINKDEISYDDIVEIVASPKGIGHIFSVTCRKVSGGCIISPGKVVEVEDSMAINAIITDNA